MADLTDVEAAQAIKIAGASGTGSETFFADVTSANRLKVDPTRIHRLYSVSAQISQATAGTDNPLILLKNPSGSVIRILVHKIMCGVNVTNTLSLFKIYSNPTITLDGVGLTERSLNIGATVPAVVATAFSLPTLSVLGGDLMNLQIGQNSNSGILTENYEITIEPNNSILITGNPSSNGREAVITVIWAEVAV